MAYRPEICRYIRWTLIGLIRLYQTIISPAFPQCCRYSPTCSEFAAGAIERHGAFRGIGLTAGRLFRCHPWGRGGFDPVPLPRTPKGQQTTP